jgi:hypothetical protein
MGVMAHITGIPALRHLMMGRVADRVKSSLGIIFTLGTVMTGIA